jgi:hypothetical protein
LLQLISDTDGVAVCNKESARVHGWTYPLDDPSHTIGTELKAELPLNGTYTQCGFLKIGNLGTFFLDSIVGRAKLYFRDPVVYDLTDVRLQEKALGLTGFWGAQDSTDFRVKPTVLARQAFFDLKSDSPNPGDPNYATNHFIIDAFGPHIGTAVCPESMIGDPVPTAPDADKDGKVHGLRDCQDGDWLIDRDPDTIFIYEQFGFYSAIAPVIEAVAKHGREDLFVRLLKTLHRHWQSDKGTIQECDPAAPRTSVRSCAQDGLVRYEPLLIEIFRSDLLPALHDAVKTVKGLNVRRCTATSPSTHVCTASVDVNGLSVLAEAVRGLLDPDRAQAIGLSDRHGKTTARRNDGTENPQVTPIDLLTQALRAVDGAFGMYAAAHPADSQRQSAWRRARSQLLDQLFTVQGQGTNSSFANAAMTRIGIALIDVLRAQLLAHCPTSFAPSKDVCVWARKDITANASATLDGPLIAASIDLLEALRRDEAARTSLEAVLQYLSDPASPDSTAIANLATLHDVLPVLQNDEEMLALLHALGPALEPASVGADGKDRGGLVDAQAALLMRLVDRPLDGAGQEDCEREADPNSVLPVVLRNLTEPMIQGGRATQPPLGVIVDTIADVNRADPETSGKLAGPDYASICENVSDFLQNQERGLEQFYEIVWRATRK